MEENTNSEAAINALREQRLQQQRAQQEQAGIEQKLEAAMRSILEPEAKQRLTNVKLSNPALYYKTVQTILNAYQQGVFNGKITESTIKQILEKLSTKREITIRRK